MQIKGNKWIGGALIVFALLEVIVSAGDFNAAWAFARLHEINPEQYTTNGIYIAAGILNLALAGIVCWRLYKAITEE